MSNYDARSWLWVMNLTKEERESVLRKEAERRAKQNGHENVNKELHQLQNDIQIVLNNDYQD